LRVVAGLAPRTRIESGVGLAPRTRD